MQSDFSFLQPKERVQLALRAIYENAGCTRYSVSRFEEYSLYQQYSSFLSSEQVITFTDLDGRLLALKPDVTLSIAKTARPAPDELLRYYYNENIYRPSTESHTYREIAQTGLEFIGKVGKQGIEQALQLALQSLSAISENYVLTISHMGFLDGLIEAAGVARSAKTKVLECLRCKNAHELRATALAAGCGAAGAEKLAAVLQLSGSYEETLSKAEQLCENPKMQDAVRELRGLLSVVGQSGSRALLDLSLAGEMEYYNGLVFHGYLAGIPSPLLKGGRYDLLMKKFCPGAEAIGFAIYLDELDRLQAPMPPIAQNAPAEKVMLNVALPKGRLGDKVYNLLAGMGYGCEEDYNANRKLVVENCEAGIRYFLVKPSDVAIYVEHGAADVGFVGKDILTEAGSDVYELLDTRLGRCRMCVAATAGYREDTSRPVRVATKFVNIAKAYYASIGRNIDIIKLNGSIELAPILGLSDVIVDIVETGTTLRENGLTVITEFMPISARFIANKASYQFKNDALNEMLTKLRSEIERKS